MDLAVLEIFKTVVEQGGINKAAQRLHRVPSNVTTRMKQLEEELGTKLFVRTGRRLAVSSAGKVLLAYADQLLKLSAQARAAVRTDEPRGVLKLGALESTAAVRLPSFLSRYHEIYPQVQIHLLTDTTAGLVSRVLSGELDAAFIGEPFDKAGLETQYVYTEDLVVIVPKTQGPVRGPKDLENPTVIGFNPGCSYRVNLEEWLGTAKIHGAPTMQFQSFQAIIAVVAAGGGIAIIPRSIVELSPARREIKVIPLPGDRAKSKTHLVWRPTHHSNALEVFKKLVAASEKLKKAASRPATSSRA